MTSWSTIKKITEELTCIMHDIQEIRSMVLGNEKVRVEIECAIDDIQELIKLCEGKE